MIPTADDPTTGRITYRAFAGWDDLPGMGAANQAHRGRIGVIERIDQVELRHYYEHLPHTDLTRDVRIVELDGRIVGYARAAWVDRADDTRTYEATILVDPSVWGRGIAAELLAWGETRLRELAVASPQPAGAPPSWYQTWLTDGDPETLPAFVSAAIGPCAVAPRWSVTPSTTRCRTGRCPTASRSGRSGPTMSAPSGRRPSACSPTRSASRGLASMTS